MAQITVSINGRSYRMACDDGEEARLIGLSQRFDESIDDLRASFGEIGDLRLTVMAGIMATDQLAESQKKLKALEEEFETLKKRAETVESAFANSDAVLAERLIEVSDRINSIAGLLTGADSDSTDTGDNQ
ncbi:cell division protein ZapA [Polycladidibacter stylochi]|uniref:cell division protein ZapA n=1 Tax=Polycladidibacter stylochi TaxID=1807766 RepID=UPI00082E0FD4|nr:cell division protein ZapA [Pseudovibrio stylochi]